MTYLYKRIQMPSLKGLLHTFFFCIEVRVILSCSFNSLRQSVQFAHNCSTFYLLIRLSIFLIKADVLLH